MLNWYKTIKEAGKEEFLLNQKPKAFDPNKWAEAVSWAMSISKKHAAWLTRLIGKNPSEFRYGEDDEKVKEALGIFERAKNRPEFPQKDINAYKGYSQLARAIEPFRERGGAREESRSKKKGGIKKIDSLNGFGLFEIKNFDGAHWVSQDTEWCISQEKYYDGYAKDGPIFFLSEGEEAYALYHSATGQFKDIYDGPMTTANTIPILDLINNNRDILELDDLEQKYDDREDSELEEDGKVIFSTPGVLGRAKKGYESFSFSEDRKRHV